MWVVSQSITWWKKKKKRFSWKLKRYNPAAGKVSFSNLSAGLQKHVHRCCYQGRVLVMSSPTTLPHCPTALTYFGMGMITSSLLGIFRQREREKERERGPCFPPKSESALCVNPLALECMFACFHENWISKELIVDGNNTNFFFFFKCMFGVVKFRHPCMFQLFAPCTPVLMSSLYLLVKMFIHVHRDAHAHSMKM